MPRLRRRRLHSEPEKQQYIGNLNIRYLKYKASLWLSRTIVHETFIGDSCFECLEFALNGLRELANDFRQLLESRCKPKTSSQYKEALQTIPEFMLSAKECRQIKAELTGCNPNHFARNLETIWDEYPALRIVLKQIMQTHCGAVKNVPVPNNFMRSKLRLQKIFGCSEDINILLEFIYILRNVYTVETFFEDYLKLYKGIQIQLLAQILNMPLERMQNALDEAHSFAFLSSEYDEPFHLEGIINKMWYAESMDSPAELFYTKLKGDTLPLENFNLDSVNVEHIKSLLCLETDEPVHILLYGVPGSGKTCFANSLAKELGSKAWSVADRVNDNDSDRRSSLVACTRISQRHKQSFVLVDEAERLLDTGISFFGKSKAWLNNFLEQKNNKIIWITNHIEHIDQAVRRRFSFSIHFEELTAEQRQSAWWQIMQKSRVSGRIDKKELENLVQQYPVSLAVLVSAVWQAKQLGHKKATFAKTIARILEAHVTLSLDGGKLQVPIKAADNYNLDGVTIETPSNNTNNTNNTKSTIETFMEKVRRMDQFLKKDGSLPQSGGTMLFYGPPGTGKTALARYIAKELGRECVVKKASDLLSMYVGQSEKNIAQAFNEAEQEGSVLVIDEADSFIYSRDMASRSWELTSVNEFLTALENFRGICVCTSNRREDMDMAAMRRFSFKIAFTYAKKEQLLTLYTNILAPLVKKPLSDEDAKLLSLCDKLTPGDFSAVRSQFWLEEEPLTHTVLLNALRQEQRMKLDAGIKRMGF